MVKTVANTAGLHEDWRLSQDLQDDEVQPTGEEEEGGPHRGRADLPQVSPSTAPLQGILTMRG